jgi:aminopeptidase N
MRTETGTVIRLEDYRPSDYLIETTDLVFTLEPEATVVRAKLSVRRREGVAADAPLALDGDELSLAGVKVNGETLAENGYTASPEKLVIGELPADDTFTVEIETRLDPSANKQLMGLYRSSGTYCTQCEAEGFRRITYFLDRPDILSVYTVRIEARTEDAPLLLSNGNKIEAGRLDNGWHYAVWHDPFPKPSYLFALVAGNLGVVRDTFTTMSGREVALEIYVEHGKEPRAAYAMDALKRSMKWDEEAFGREYDLDVFMIVAVSDFNMGAMENKGLNVFNDKYVLADERTATDADYANIEAIIAHEYFHNWTGNRITCRDWFQLCLKEGLTVFRDHEFSADMRSRTVKRIAEVKLLKAHQFPEDAGPLAHPVRPRRYSEINNFYTATVYEKGSEVVRMIRTILGEDGFRGSRSLFRPARRRSGDDRAVRQGVRGRDRCRPGPILAVVRAAGHAEPDRRYPVRRGGKTLHADDRATAQATDRWRAACADAYSGEIRAGLFRHGRSRMVERFRRSGDRRRDPFA